MIDLDKLDKIKINFIVGPGRSGTTLLMHILNQSNTTIASPEIKHFIYFYNKYKNITEITTTILNDYKDYLILFHNRGKKFFHCDPAKTLLFQLKEGDKINYNQLSKLLYLCLAEKKQDINMINCIIDKNPYYTFYLDKILPFYKDAKVLVMVRDYRGYILSNRQIPEFKKSTYSVFYYALVWNYFIKKVFIAQKKYRTRIKIIKYEELATDKEKTIENICHYFDIVYEAEMLDFHEIIREKLIDTKLVSETSAKKIRMLKSPINDSRVNSWQTELSKRDLQKADFICGKNGIKLGYTLMAHINFLNKILFLFNGIIGYSRLLAFKLFDSPTWNHYLVYKRGGKK